MNVHKKGRIWEGKIVSQGLDSVFPGQDVVNTHYMFLGCPEQQLVHSPLSFMVNREKPSGMSAN